MNDEIKPLVEAIKELAARVATIENALIKKTGDKSVWELKTIIEAKQTLADRIRNKYSSEAASGRMWDDEPHHQEWAALMKQIRKLNEQLSSMGD